MSVTYDPSSDQKRAMPRLGYLVEDGESRQDYHWESREGSSQSQEPQDEGGCSSLLVTRAW